MNLSLIEESNFLEAQYNKLHGNFWPRHAPYAVAVINAKPFLEAQKAPCLGEPPSVGERHLHRPGLVFIVCTHSHSSAPTTDPLLSYQSYLAAA